jgi:hypothetical protein
VRTLLTPAEYALLASCRTPNEVIFCEALVEELGPLSQPGAEVVLVRGGRKPYQRISESAAPGRESRHISADDLQLWSDT